ncbi:MAG: helix-turn-helix domain-containing protein [Candidatus Pelagibacter sp.]|tara:strand:+ start:36 stop:599 length:564 start_codon:yes stop_codon:yes gene_type:complete
MNKQHLIIYDFAELFFILNEIKSNLNFQLLNVSKQEFIDLKIKYSNSHLIIAKKKIPNLTNQIVLDNLPLKISKIIETININFLKNKFNQQSEIDLGLYKLNLNTRKMFNNKIDLNLTEKEAEIIIFLKKSEKSVSIDKLQTEVWGHSSKLETHTVETHIYRLRKKINDKFNNNDFIKSTKSGYKIK